MVKITCPKCGEEIKLGKDAYNELLEEIKFEEVEKRIKLKEDDIRKVYEAKLALEANKAKTAQDALINKLEAEKQALTVKLENSNKDIEIAVNKATQSLKEDLSKKDKDLLELNTKLAAEKQNSIDEANKQKQNYEFALAQKEEEIKKWRDFRLGDSTKDLGESLEQYCYDAFEEIRAVAYPRAKFYKDNVVDEEGKGDFIFEDYAEDGTLIVSIMFEMKNQKDTTKTKHKNEHFFEKLDKNRNSKGCEYAVLVSTLEEDRKLYNDGIVDVSHRYPKMFVVRPHMFLSIIGLIRNLSLNNVEYRRQVDTYRNQNADITNFEEAVRAIGEKINNDYVKANAIYNDVDKMCDDIIKKVESFRKQFKTAAGHIGAAVNQLPNLEIRKLTKNNPTMKDKFDTLEKNKKEGDAN